MSARRRQLATLLVGVLLTALLLHALAVASGQITSADSSARLLRTTSAERLTGPPAGTALEDVRATSDLTATLGATLAANLLLSPITFELDLPLMVR